MHETEENKEVAITQNQIGFQYYGLNNRSLEMWQKVLAVKMNIFKTEENPSIVTTLNNIAVVWSQLGDHRRSLEEHQKVLDLWLTIFKTEEHPDVA